MNPIEKLQQLNDERRSLVTREAEIVRSVLEEAGLYVAHIAPTADGLWAVTVGAPGQKRATDSASEAPVPVAPREEAEAAKPPAPPGIGTVAPRAAEMPTMRPKPIGNTKAPAEASTPAAECQAPGPVWPAVAPIEPPKPTALPTPPPPQTASKPSVPVGSGAAGPVAGPGLKHHPIGLAKQGEAAKAKPELEAITFLTPEQQKRKKMEAVEAIKGQPIMTLAELHGLAQKGPSGLLVARQNEKRENQYRSQLDTKTRAIRLARTLVSDIVAYRDTDHQKALKSGVAALRKEFALDLEKAKGRFYEQVSVATVADRDRIFVGAVNEILGFNLQVWL